MEKTAILVDSNSGFTPEDVAKAGIELLPMPFYINGELKYEHIDFAQENFFEALNQGCEVTTSMPIVGDVVKLWKGLLERYEEILFIPSSAALSGTCETCKILAKDFGNRIEVVDNRRIGPTMQDAAFEAKYLASRGKSAKEIRLYLEEHAAESTIYIMVDTLKYLRKGGRLTPAVAAIGTLLHIRPVLQIQGDKLDTFSMARTVRQAKQIMIDAIAKDLKERFFDPEGDGVVFNVAHSDNLEQAKIFRDEVMKRFPGHEIKINPLALSVACHIGPGALAVTASKTIVPKENR